RSGRQPADGALGDMALPGMQAPNGSLAQALLQPIDQPRQLLRRGALVMSRIPCRRNAEALLVLGQALDGQYVHGRRLEAELGGELAAQAIETQADQLGDMLRVPARRREPQIERQRLPVDLEQQE